MTMVLSISSPPNVGHHTVRATVTARSHYRLVGDKENLPPADLLQEWWDHVTSLSLVKDSLLARWCEFVVVTGPRSLLLHAATRRNLGPNIYLLMRASLPQVVALGHHQYTQALFEELIFILGAGPPFWIRLILQHRCLAVREPGSSQALDEFCESLIRSAGKTHIAAQTHLVRNIKPAILRSRGNEKLFLVYSKHALLLRRIRQALRAQTGKQPARSPHHYSVNTLELRLLILRWFDNEEIFQKDRPLLALCGDGKLPNSVSRADKRKILADIGLEAEEEAASKCKAYLSKTMRDGIASDEEGDIDEGNADEGEEDLDSD